MAKLQFITKLKNNTSALVTLPPNKTNIGTSGLLE